MSFEFHIYRLKRWRRNMRRMPSYCSVPMAENTRPYRVVGKLHEVCVLGVCFQVIVYDS